MLNMITSAINAVFALLPDSPFKEIIDSFVIEFKFIKYLNWFIPFDLFSSMMLSWLECVVIYYTFEFVRYVVDKLFDFITEITSVVKGFTK